MEFTVIPRKNFTDAFTRVGWKVGKDEVGKYDVFTSPMDKNIWTVLPVDESLLEYKFYQSKSIKFLLYVLDMTESDENISEIHNQLLGYNYKLISKIVNKDKFKKEAVPFEIANALPSKNIDAFRSFYLRKNKGKAIPIERFEFNHTQKGSFIIPVSIAADIGQETLINLPNNTNVIIREYLDTVDKLVHIDLTDEKRFADKILEEGIDSDIVKDFFSKHDSIAKFKDKYKDQIKELSISSKSNPILDYHLSKSDKEFKTVDLEKLQIIPEEYITYLEKREVELDTYTRDEKNVTLEVVVDSIDLNGTAKFRVFSINNESIKVPFKANTHELSKLRLDFCADAFKSRDPIIIRGDILKAKGKIGKIIVDDLKSKEKEPTLFSKTS